MVSVCKAHAHACRRAQKLVLLLILGKNVKKNKNCAINFSNFLCIQSACSVQDSAQTDIVLVAVTMVLCSSQHTCTIKMHLVEVFHSIVSGGQKCLSGGVKG